MCSFIYFLFYMFICLNKIFFRHLNPPGLPGRLPVCRKIPRYPGAANSTAGFYLRLLVKISISHTYSKSP